MVDPDYMQIIRGDGGQPEFLERFVNAPPAGPSTIRVLEDRWDFDGDTPVRTILRFEVADLPNRADAAWEELQALRAEAKQLGVDVDPTDPLVIVREKVEAARRS